jgi:hypothetical protein
MTGENSGTAGKELSGTVFDPMHVWDRIVGSAMGVYVIGAGGLMIWRALAGQATWDLRQLLLGIFFSAILGPAAIYFLGFRARNRARAIPIARVKRVVGSLAGFVAAALGLCAMWFAIFDPSAAAKGIDWDILLTASGISMLGLYGLYACAWRGVDVADFSG